jgi:hypothetical protein
VNVGAACLLKLLNEPSQIFGDNYPFLVPPKLALTDAGGNIISDDSSTVVSALVVPSLAHSTRLVVDTSSGKLPDILRVTYDETIIGDLRSVYSPSDIIGIVVKLDHEVTVTLNGSCTNSTTYQTEKPFIQLNSSHNNNNHRLDIAPARAILSDMFLNLPTSDLLFLYNVGFGQDQDSLLYTSNGGVHTGDYSIKDLLGRSVALILPSEADKRNQLVNKPIRIDSSPAYVLRIYFEPPMGLHGAGKDVFVNVEFNRRVCYLLFMIANDQPLNRPQFSLKHYVLGCSLW